ncbi:MAG: septum formation protein Maf [Chitinophagaceae bacterium]|nr:MAG: septum formation protein Maf [Chitinophagaceae bacterium]
MTPIILASSSPRRKQLLEWAEVPFEIMVQDTDESYPAGLSMSDTAVHIARNKALAVSVKHPSRIVLAADTIVVLGNRIIGKPAGREDALSTLASLSGQTHHVITGVVIIFNGKETAFADVTEVSFHELADEGIRFYVDKYKPYDKAGAYAIQEWIGVTGIRSVQGDFYNVMGLPVSRVVQALQAITQ